MSINRADIAEQIARLKNISSEELLDEVQGHNYGSDPIEFLVTIAERRDCTLLTAMEILLWMYPEDYENGDASKDMERFPGAYNLLCYIQERANSGGYAHDQNDLLKHRDFDETHFLVERAKQGAKRTGDIWFLEPSIILPALTQSEETTDALEKRKQAASEERIQSNAERILDYERHSPKLAESMYEICPDDIKQRVQELRAKKKPFWAKFFGR